VLRPYYPTKVAGIATLVQAPPNGPEKGTSTSLDNGLGLLPSFSAPGTMNFREISTRPLSSDNTVSPPSPRPRLAFVSQSPNFKRMRTEKSQQSSSSADSGPSQSLPPAVGVDGKTSDFSSNTTMPLEEQTNPASSSETGKAPSRAVLGSNPQATNSPAPLKPGVSRRVLGIQLLGHLIGELQTIRRPQRNAFPHPLILHHRQNDLAYQHSYHLRASLFLDRLETISLHYLVKVEGVKTSPQSGCSTMTLTSLVKGPSSYQTKSSRSIRLRRRRRR
jgi:hypothetical protein